MLLFTKAQIEEMNNTMHLASPFIDVNNKKEVLNCIFTSVSFYEKKITEAQKEEALTFAKNY